MVWPFRRRQPSALISVSDPAFAAHFGVGPLNLSGVQVGELSALGLSAVWRAVSLISETLASLPARTMVEAEDGRRSRVRSFLDNPGQPVGLTPFAFWETVLCHLLLHGNAYLLHIRNGGGGLAGLLPIHPLSVSAEWNLSLPGRKEFRATLVDGTSVTLDATTCTQIMGKSLDMLRGLSPIAVARNSLGTGIAGDRAAAKMFSSGALHSGMVTPAEDADLEQADAERVKADLDASVSGWEHAAELVVINRRLKFTPWTMSAEDAQFIQSRQFSVEEVARWFGLPSFALNLEQKSTSWGSGIESMQRGLARQVLGPWTTRISQPLSMLLPSGRSMEFDFAALERPTPEVEATTMLSEVAGGVRTPNEYRRARGMEPIEGGDVLSTSEPAQSDPAAVTP